jgi:hypothetical protein
MGYIGFGSTGNSDLYLYTVGDSIRFLANSGLQLTVGDNTISGDVIKDEDNMASNSAVHLATQQSIKKYVDDEVAGAGGGVTDHGELDGLGDNDHSQYILHTLAGAVNDFIVASGANTYVKKTLAETGAILEGDLQHNNLQGYSTDYHFTKASIDHGGIGGLGDNDHSQYVLHSLADAANDFLVASGANTYVKKTLAQTGAILEGDLQHNNLQGYSTSYHFTKASIDHGGIGGLGDDDHALYLLASDATNRASFASSWTDLTDGGGSALHSHDHGNMTGRTDDDHTAYLRIGVLRNTTSAGISNATSPYFEVRDTTATANRVLMRAEASIGWIGTYSSNVFQIRSNNTARLSFAAAGEATFSKKLHIKYNDATEMLGLWDLNASSASNATPWLSYKWGAGGTGLGLIGYANTTSDEMWISNVGEGILFFSSGTECGRWWGTLPQKHFMINDTIWSDGTIGMVIDQDTYDDTILAFQASEVNHGATALVETDTYGAFQKWIAAYGGLQIQGLTESEVGLALVGTYKTNDTGKTITSDAAVVIQGRRISGTSYASMGANANILAIKNNTTTRWIVDEDGDTWQSGSLTLGSQILTQSVLTGLVATKASFFAHKTVAQNNFAVNTNVQITFGQVYDDTGSYASNQFVAPVTAKYHLFTSVMLQNVDSNATYYKLWIATTNRIYQTIVSPQAFDSNPAFHTLSVSVIADMTAANTAKVYVYQLNGSQITDISTDTSFNFFGGRQMG